MPVEALSTKIVKDCEYDRELAKVRVVSSIKEPAPRLAGAIVSAYPYGMNICRRLRKPNI